jgi:hypothetical protein
MFIRKRKNKGGTTSVVVVEKRKGIFKEIKNFGHAADDKSVLALCEKASEWILRHGGQTVIDFDDPEPMKREMEETERVIANMDAILINGTQIILEKIYGSVGFNAIHDDTLRHLVIARASMPLSKRATVDYLKSYYDEDVNLNKIYRYMDKLYNTQMEDVQKISVAHTRQLLGGRIGLIFYDVTTLYFETSRTDVLREPGFSKDGKDKESQVVIGLLVSEGGYPLSYSLFNGSQYEGFTMMPIIDDFRQRFSLGDDVVVVADSGLMSNRNVKLLQQAHYKYIIGARIKSEQEDVKKWILSIGHEDMACVEMKRQNGERLIVSYYENRARKDARNREKGVARLRKAYRSGTLTKDKVNKIGYNKFLELERDVKVTISEDKIIDDAKWDGLKGYITNTDLNCEEVINQYHGLWVVERAFRVTKGTLEARPMFHFTERKIEAHVCICFCAYKVYKELQRIILLIGMKNISADTVLSIAKTITTIRVRLPQNKCMVTKTMLLTDRQRILQPLFDAIDSNLSLRVNQ